MVKSPLRLSALGLAVILMLTSGLAGAGMQEGPPRPVVWLSAGDQASYPAECEPPDDPTVDPTEGPVAGPTVAPSPSTASTCEPPDGDGDGDGGGGGGTEDGAERLAACEQATGQTSEGEDGKLTGLDRAIDRVLANCIKNPQAPGLLNALEHLKLNRERQGVREEERAARKEAREAAREARAAERKARKESRKTAQAARQGSKGGEGHGSGGPPGHAQGEGNGQGHGNPH